jgi:ubiquinone/menaquinone biosynthesis C-methylase UbiE
VAAEIIMALQAVAASLLRSFFAINRRMCAKISHYIPQPGLDMYKVYADRVSGLMNLSANQIVLDVGSGKQCAFAARRDPALETRIFGVDISHEEIACNSSVDVRLVANVAQDLPFRDGTVDLITSSAVLEHLKNVGAFVGDSARVLRRKGYFVTVFPAKFAPFALINRMLPPGVSRSLVHFLAPDKKGKCGFRAFYDRCYYSAFRELLHKHQLDLIDVEFGYFQSEYFNFFAPAFLLVRWYENLMQRLSAKNLCAYLLIVARKK